MKKNIKLFSIFVLFFMIFFLGLASITGAAEDSVTTTVTVQNIALSITDEQAPDASVSYGTLGTSASQTTLTTGVNDTQTITNDGNVNEDFDLKGANTGTWTLASSIGVEDEYKHDWCTSDCEGTPTWTALTTGYVQIATGVASSGTQDFDLRMNTPSSTTVYTEQTATVWVQASAT